MPEEDRKPGPWTIAKSITSGEPETTNLIIPRQGETIAELTEKRRQLELEQNEVIQQLDALIYD